MYKGGIHAFNSGTKAGFMPSTPVQRRDSCLQLPYKGETHAFNSRTKAGFMPLLAG
jgi:hypothetical protein